MPSTVNAIVPPTPTMIQDRLANASPAVMETMGLNLGVRTVTGTVSRMIHQASMVSSSSKCSKRNTSSVYKGSRKKICQNMIQKPEKMIRNDMKRKLANTMSMSRNTLPNVRTVV